MKGAKHAVAAAAAPNLLARGTVWVFFWLSTKNQEAFTVGKLDFFEVINEISSRAFFLCETTFFMFAFFSWMMMTKIICLDDVVFIYVTWTQHNKNPLHQHSNFFNVHIETWMRRFYEAKVSCSYNNRIFCLSGNHQRKDHLGLKPADQPEDASPLPPPMPPSPRGPGRREG